MAKPRNSVLFMFDPLQQSPSASHRDLSSPELSPSDKENDAPAGDITMFFDRMYVTHKQPDARVFTPKGKLIDFGDTPAPVRPVRVWDVADHDGSDADGEQSEGEAGGYGVIPLSRPPLADLDLEHTPRPVVKSRPPKASIFASPSQDPEPLPAFLAPAPHGTPLAEVLNSIHYSPADTSGDSTLQLQPSPELEERQPPAPFPEINVCAPETPALGGLDTPSSEEQVEPAAYDHLRAPSTLTQLSPEDPRRTSVDLYSSFHLQLQSDEMSFDLLNDKISFFGHGQDSFWAGGDDTHEFEEMSIPPAMKAKLEQLLPTMETMPKNAQRVESPPLSPSQAIEVRSCSNMSPTTESALNVPRPLSPVYSAPPSRNVTPPRLQLSTLDEPPSPPTSPIVADEPSLLLESEPLPPPIQPIVPALRIFKKTWKMACHQNSVPSNSKSGTAAAQRAERVEDVMERKGSLARAAAKPATAAAQPVRAPIRGVQRPPASMQAAGGVIIGLPPQGASASSSSGSSSGPCPTHTADSVAPASRFAGIQRPNLAAKEKAASRIASGGLRSTTSIKSAAGPVRTAMSGSSKMAAPAAGVLRPPSRIVTPGSGMSTLPKPTSRLPGLIRTASMSVGQHSAAAANCVARARSSTLSKAARF